MQANNQHPPVRAWPPEVYPQEPAHGYFVRLASRNGAQSTKVFADSVGLNGRNPDPAELLDFCSRFPLRGLDFMTHGSPRIEGSYLYMNGQKFNTKRDWSMVAPRVCAACIGEKRYYRNWWDLTVLSFCPVHGRPLIAGTDQARLRWWCPEVGITTDGQDLASDGTSRVTDVPRSWDSYVLGRMGVTDPFSSSLIDNLDLCDVIDLAELIGRADRSGWSIKTPHRLPYRSALRCAALAVGFEILNAGEGSINSFLHRYLETRDESLATKADGYYGWIAGCHRQLAEGPGKELFRKCMNTVASDNGVYRRTGRAAAVEGSCRVTLRELAFRLELTPVVLRRVAIGLGLTTDNRDRWLRHWFDHDAVQFITRYVKDLLPLDKSAELLAISVEELRALQVFAFIKPVLRQAGIDYFDPEALKSFILAQNNRSTSINAFARFDDRKMTKAKQVAQSVLMRLELSEKDRLRINFEVGVVVHKDAGPLSA